MKRVDTVKGERESKIPGEVRADWTGDADRSFTSRPSPGFVGVQDSRPDSKDRKQSAP